MIKVHYEYGFSYKKTPTEAIKKEAFGGTYFRDVYSGINGKQYRKSWKKLDELTLIRLGFFRVVFPRGKSDPHPYYFKKDLSNISITF